MAAVTPTTLDKVVLVGPRASGKTTLAAALGPRLAWPIADTDALIAARVGRAPGDFLAVAGEAQFRVAEAEVCLQVLGDPAPRVVALGGGAVLSAAVREALQRPGVLVVFVHAALADLVERQGSSAVVRPRLTDLPLAAEVEQLWRARLALYETVAHARISTSMMNVDGCVAAVLAKIARILLLPGG